MVNIYGPREWHDDVQSCTIHGVPMLPCPQCLAERNADIQVSLDAGDRVTLDFDPECTVADLMPAAHPWLIRRLVL